MIVRKVIAQLQFNKYFSQETQFYLKPYKDICVRLILVNRSSFYVNSLEQFKTPKQTFLIDNRFTAVAVANFPFVNGRCHLERSMPFLKLAEQTTALVNSSYAVGTLGRHFRAVLFIRWRSNPRARELSQLKQNEPILLVQKQKKIN